MLDGTPIEIPIQSETDNLFESGRYPVPFEFNEEVAKVFDDMVSRSVPFYKEVNRLIVQWVHMLGKENDTIVDIGCSTGITLCSIGRSISFGSHLVGIDNSEAMLEKAEAKLVPYLQKHQVDFIKGDVATATIPAHQFSILNYTLQFIPNAKRISILKKIASSLTDGGFLFLSEKIRSDNPVIQEGMTKIYEDYKYRVGYSQNEIERKKEALDRVLVPSTIEELFSMLYDAGFTSANMMFQYNNFVSIMAHKKENNSIQRMRHN